MASSFLCLSLLFISLSSADGFKMYMMNRCVFNSTEPKDIKYIVSYYYNKIEVNRFDSDVGKFVGFTEYGLRNAETWNSGAYLTQMKAEKTICQQHTSSLYSGFLSKSGPSSSSSEEHEENQLRPPVEGKLSESGN